MNKRYMRFLDVKGILSRMENLGIKILLNLQEKVAPVPLGCMGS